MRVPYEIPTQNEGCYLVTSSNHVPYLKRDGVISDPARECHTGNK